MTTPQTVLHVGFHKAASHQIQHALRHAGATLEQQGIQYVHLRDLRRMLVAGRKTSQAATAGKFFAGLRRRRPKRLILSDENLLGPIGHCVRTGQLFQQQSPLLTLTAQEIPFDIKEIYLAVQSYGDFFTAAYIEYLKGLKSKNTKFVTARTMCHRVFDQLYGWPDVIDTLTTHFPNARLYVWQHKDFRTKPDLSQQVFSALIGEDAKTAGLELRPHFGRRGPFSARAVTTLETLAITQGIGAVVAARKEIRAIYPVSDAQPRFDPFLAWEGKHLDRLYETDLAQIRKRGAVTLIE